MSTPELDAAIRDACLADPTVGGSVCEFPSERCERFCSGRIAACKTLLRSLAAPTPEAIEAMAVALQEHIRCDASGLAPAIASVFLIGFKEAAHAAHTTYWAHILGETPEPPK